MKRMTVHLSNKKRKKNDPNDEWVDCGRLEFYLEVPRVAPGSEENRIKELKQHINKILKVTKYKLVFPAVDLIVFGAWW